MGDEEIGILLGSCPKIVGSNPTLPTFEGVAEWFKAIDCKSIDF
jgi:hypothetical protein